MNLREEGYDVIRYTTKSGKSLEYSATDKEEWNIIKKLIKNLLLVLNGEHCIILLLLQSSIQQQNAVEKVLRRDSQHCLMKNLVTM